MPKGVRPETRESVTQLLMEWDELAATEDPACRDQPLTFIDHDKIAEKTSARAEAISLAKSICFSCPFVEMCDEYAKLTKPYQGVWGGKLWNHGKVAKYAVVANGESETETA